MTKKVLKNDKEIRDNNLVQVLVEKDDTYIWVFDKPWEQIGKVWVDSGMVAIADPCYLLSKEEYKETFIKNYETQPHAFKRGVVESGHGGDGDFPVYVKKNKNGLVLEMKVVFNHE